MVRLMALATDDQWIDVDLQENHTLCEELFAQLQGYTRGARPQGWRGTFSEVCLEPSHPRYYEDWEENYISSDDKSLKDWERQLPDTVYDTVDDELVEDRDSLMHGSESDNDSDNSTYCSSFDEADLLDGEDAVLFHITRCKGYRPQASNRLKDVLEFLNQEDKDALSRRKDEEFIVKKQVVEAHGQASPLCQPKEGKIEMTNTLKAPSQPCAGTGNYPMQSPKTSL